MELFSLLVVLAITYSQGAARPYASDLNDVTSNGSSYSEENEDGKKFTFPTSIKKGLLITITGTLNMNDKTFIVDLPSQSSKESCQMKFNFESKTISITPNIGNTSYEYDAHFSSESGEAPKFTLQLKARLLRGARREEAFTMIFNGNNAGESAQLTCKVTDFQYINSIIFREGVEHVDSIQFEFAEDQ